MSDLTNAQPDIAAEFSRHVTQAIWHEAEPFAAFSEEFSRCVVDGFRLSERWMLDATDEQIIQWHSERTGWKSKVKS